MANQRYPQGRLASALHPEAHAIVFPPLTNSDSARDELQCLVELTKAHLVVLARQSIVPNSSIKAVLHVLMNLEEESFSALLSQKNERGLYYVLENYLIDHLGVDVAGAIHVGRSRNDMNATLCKQRLRVHYAAIGKHLLDLRASLLSVAARHFDTVMPLYSQYQVAQVSTYAHYLLALNDALARDMRDLHALTLGLNECPLGAGTGCGTSVPIDNTQLAYLLGFSSVTNNALDAIASRDITLRFLSAASVLGVNLSRLAQDFQLWTTQEFQFFELPDNLCGGSSMMPQKKNPYLLEVIKGKTAGISGCLMQSLTAMHAVPMMNSMEVGTYATQGLFQQLTEVTHTLILSRLILEGAVPVISAMKKRLVQGVAVATQLAEDIATKTGQPFRSVHAEIGALIQNALQQGQDPHVKLCDYYGYSDSSLLSADALNVYGAGPGLSSIQTSYAQAEKQLRQDQREWQKVNQSWSVAAQQLHCAVLELINR